MLRAPQWLGVWVLACAGCGASPPPEQAAPLPEEPPASAAPVALAALADVTRVAPGQEFVIAARFEIGPGWHIHWENPGESGRPTRVDFTVPAGFAVSGLRYPGPERFEAPDAATGYGYSGQVMLSAVVTAPDPLPAGESFDFGVEASWLACERDCEPGSDRAELSLRPASAEAPSQPAHTELFAAHHERLPVAWEELEGVEHRWLDAEGQLELVLSVPGDTAIELYPDVVTASTLMGQARAPADGTTSLRLLLRSDLEPSGVGGVVRIDEHRYARLDLARPD